MIPEEVTPPDSSAQSEGSQPKDSPQEAPDTARGEAFKRMFPDVPTKPPERPKNPPTKRAGSPCTGPVRALDGYVFDESGYTTTHQHPVSFDSTFCRRLDEV